LGQIFSAMLDHKGIFLYLLLMMSVMLCLSHGNAGSLPPTSSSRSARYIPRNRSSAVKSLYLPSPSSYNIGAIIGALIFGQLSQTIGRRLLQSCSPS